LGESILPAQFFCARKNKTSAKKRKTREKTDFCRKTFFGKFWYSYLYDAAVPVLNFFKKRSEYTHGSKEEG